MSLRTAWITGAGSGMGRALALALARRGAAVAASARSHDALASLAAEAGAGPGRILPAPLDVTDRAAVQAAMGAVARVLGGPPELAVLNAGIYLPLGAADFSAERFRAQLETNLMGTVHMLEALLPAYRAAGRGHIAIVASVAGYRGLPRSAAYGATKAALINLAESLRIELAGSGIKLQLVNPGFIKTPLTDKNRFRMPHLMSAEDAAERILRGLASPRFEITFPRRFTWQLKLLRLLPYALYLPLVRRRTGA